MNRECLLSRSYTGEPLTLNGKPIFFSAIVNDIVRELKIGVFTEAEDQTDNSAISEAVMIMDLVEVKNYKRINELRSMPREQRHSDVLTYALENNDEIERLKPLIIERLQRLFAVAIESEAKGKQV